MGNPAKPTALKILEGNRGHQPIPNNPQYPLAEIEPPKYVRHTQRRVWKYYAPILYRAGVLTIVDMIGFERMTKIYALVLDAEKEGKFLIGLTKELRFWLQEFGMTPASRAKIDIVKPIKTIEGYID